MTEWECKECGSNSTMPKEHGCDSCQDFVSNKLEGRVAPTQTNSPYDQYAVNDDYKVAISRVDYAVLTKEVLVRLQDLLEQDTFDNATAINLTKTALDYLVYLEDNRRVII